MSLIGREFFYNCEHALIHGHKVIIRTEPVFCSDAGEFFVVVESVDNGFLVGVNVDNLERTKREEAKA